MFCSILILSGDCIKNISILNALSQKYVIICVYINCLHWPTCLLSSALPFLQLSSIRYCPHYTRPIRIAEVEGSRSHYSFQSISLCTRLLLFLEERSIL